MRLHHVAYVTKDSQAKAQLLADLLGLRQAAEVVVDHDQGVRVLFVDTGSAVQIELLEPLGPDSPVQGALRSGRGLYHLCFETDDLDRCLAELERSGEAKVVKAPTPAPAIGNRRVAFVVTSDGDLIELLESHKR